MTSTPAYGFRINKGSEGPMQTAIKAGDTGQIQQLLAKRFPGLKFESLGTEEETVDKPQEQTPTVAPMGAGLRRRSTPAVSTTGTELIGDLYNDYVINLPTAARNLVTTDYKGTRGQRLGSGGYTTQSLIPGAQIEEPAAATKPAAEETKAPDVSIQYGASAERFGHEDYWQNLSRGATPEQLRSYVQQNVNLLGEGNRPGQGGLYDEIMSGSVRTNWSQPSSQQLSSDVSSGAAASRFVPTLSGPQQSGPVTTVNNISTGAGASAEAFGHADVAAARARGASTQEILNFVNSNRNLLKGGNVPGGGGLYDQLLRGEI